MTDSSGASIPGASVAIANGTVSKSTTTGADGKFSFAGLPAGTYTLTATANGFDTQTKALSLTLGQSSNVTFAMNLAASKQEVTVQSGDSAGVSVDPSENASQLTLSNTDMDAL
ncbi:MAG: carboxypeptidase regulatory-like domain-containing protein, partial [Acidobacteriota bacterium]|nr:carboxypeptidase regulatory-like domain-containing protein [Acidobacteriota bacterium]